MWVELQVAKGNNMTVGMVYVNPEIRNAIWDDES